MPGALHGLLSALSFGLMGFLVNLGAGKLPSQEMVFFRAFVSFLVLTPFAIRQAPKLFAKEAQIVWLRSISGSLSLLCFFANLQQARVGDAVVLAHTAPIFVVVLSWLFLKERLAKKEAVGIGLLIAGAAVLQSPSLGIPARVLVTGLSGAFFASLAYMALRKSAVRFPPNLIVWCFSGLGALVAIGIPGEPWFFPKSQDWPLVVGVGLSGLFGQIFLTHSYIKLRASIASALGLTSLLWGVALESLILHRYPTPASLAAYALMIGGVVIIQTRLKS